MCGFKTDCPHYESREHISKYDKFTILPEDKRLQWCGDRGEWIEKCDGPAYKKALEILSEGLYGIDEANNIYL